MERTLIGVFKKKKEKRNKKEPLAAETAKKAAPNASLTNGYPTCQAQYQRLYS